MLNRFKYGDCVRCSAKDTECKKRGKELLCLACCKGDDIKKATVKANLKQRVRKLGNDKIQNGDYDDAYIQGLKRDLDYVASRICRITAADERGNVKCYTCRTVRHFSLMQAGHFIGRACMLLRWDLRRNLRPQCPSCNINLYGNLEVYADELNKEQPELSTTLKILSRDTYKHSQDELKQLLIDIRSKLKIIEQKWKK